MRVGEAGQEKGGKQARVPISGQVPPRVASAGLPLRASCVLELSQPEARELGFHIPTPRGEKKLSALDSCWQYGSLLYRRAAGALPT